MRKIKRDFLLLFNYLQHFMNIKYFLLGDLVTKQQQQQLPEGSGKLSSLQSMPFLRMLNE